MDPHALARLLVVALLAIAASWPRAAASQPVRDFSGRVFDARSQDGIQNLEVKLTPPRAATVPIRLAQTGRNGEFLFPRLAPGRYLIEVSQGPHLLYRVEIDTTRQPQLAIPLQRR